MPMPSLADLIAPERCALVTQEVQGAVVGPNAGLPQLADEARREAIPNIVRLVEGARAAGVQVVHCVIAKRADGLGSGENCRLYQAGKRMPMDLTPGGEGASVLPELRPAADDLLLTRSNGLGPMGGTDLDPVLRNLGVTTIIGVGVSVNIAITNFVMDAVNGGYWFVLPRDAVAGVPREYSEQVIDTTLSLLASVVSTDEILEAWSVLTN
jgi:nicotinamidase-related amidase